MRRSIKFHLGITLAVAGLSPAIPPCLRAQALPPTAPTTLPSNNSLPSPIAGTSTPGLQASHQPHHAEVTLVDGNLNVRANDSSLNQILRSISRATGLKITGGVQDERVFGNYGPAPISSVLATLLGGTGTNILFLAGDASNPPQLVLTPRGGGATPPTPDSASYAAYDEAPIDTPAQPQPIQSHADQSDPGRSDPRQATLPQPAAASAPLSSPQPLNNVNGSPANTSPTASTFPTTQSVPLDAVPTPSTTPSTSGIVDAPNPPPADSTTGTAPSGALTPEQVYQQLLQRQQSQQPPPADQPTTPAPQQ